MRKSDVGHGTSFLSDHDLELVELRVLNANTRRFPEELAGVLA